MARLADVTTWVFDLDHTLYPADMRLFDQISARMNDWISQALNVSAEHASHLRQHYWETYGATLAGLMREHQIDPDPYLRDVHDIDFTVLDPDPALRSAIRGLKGRKVIFTNGPSDYAEKVISALDLTDTFDAIYGVEEADLHLKPAPKAYDAVFAKAQLEPARAAMIEDAAHNLVVPHQKGLATVLVAPTPEPQDHIHHHTDDLTRFLNLLH